MPTRQDFENVDIENIDVSLGNSAAGHIPAQVVFLANSLISLSNLTPPDSEHIFIFLD
jgi:hypothetical protein